LTSNPVPTNNPISTVDKLKQILKTVTDAALFIEQILAVTGLEGASAAEVERLTVAFGNLAAIAIQAAHDAAGKEITPSSVLALLPVSTPLVAPSAG
jgi:hypothetical protein